MWKIVFVAVCFFSVASAAQMLVGGFSDADVDSEFVVKAARFAANDLNKDFATRNHMKLTTIEKAQTQVVAGVNYKLTIVFKETNCPKNEVDYDAIENCDYLENGAVRRCEVRVYRDLDGNHSTTRSACFLVDNP